MKKILSLFFASVLSLSLSAQVYYLLPNSDGWNSEAVTNVYDNTTKNPAQNQLQWEVSEGEVQQVPERKAYEWFKDTYNGGAQKVITYDDLTDGRLLSDGDLFDDVKVLWVNVDRNMTVTQFDELFPSDVRTALANYVKAGGNLYLSTFAVRLAYLIGRTPEPGFSENDGFCCSDEWKVNAHFMKGGEGGYDVDKHGHAIYKDLVNHDPTMYADNYKFHMQKGGPRTNRNCLWDIEDNMTAFNNFQNNNTCGILGSWGHTAEFCCAGLVEFYPTGDWKGTIITNGLAACSFANSNTDRFCVELLTNGVLNYLKSTKPVLAWNKATVPASGVIGEDHIITALVNDPYFTIRYSADAPEIANIGNVDGRVFYNYFGTATFHATVSAGDGWTLPKNAVAASIDTTITVNGGTEANPRYAYVLPYSLHVMANYDNEEDRRPDYEAAQWFHDQFIAGEVGGKHGVYVRPADLASLNSAIKVLWIHNDHIGQTAQSYYDDLGGDTFRGNLAAFLENGGNVLVTKQATRLIGDLGRNVYPEYHNGDDGRGYADRGPWRIANKWNLGGTEIDHSTHSVYANMGTDTWLMAAGRHTDNNDIWTNFGAYGDEDPQRITKYEEDHNCKVLGAYGHYDNNNVVSPKIECVGMVEYYPQDNLTLNASSTTYDQKGTIIALGLAAYHWIKDINETEKTPPLMKNFTRDILYYLNIDDAPGFAWETAPADGLAGTEQIVEVEQKTSAIEWTSSNTDVVEIVDDPDHAGSHEFKKLILKAAGEATITVTRSGDGYYLPKSVTNTTQVTKTITVTNAYTRDVTEGAYGTICLPKAAASYTGATMFRIADKTENGIVIEEVNAMEAGKPYIFQATASTINVTYGGGAPVAASSDNGLIGYIGENNLELTANENHYILANDQMWKVNVTVQVPSNRAYVDMNAINATPQAAPRRHISVKNTPTGVDELQETNGAVKQIKDGQLIIIRNEHMFNVQGQMIQ